ncbi:hypothetical protein COLO4_11291 [Corchorus olitorius]|uniref:Uncharacterized protein n=1 Tax=Corchorus olitorius TaxID=93759 RepID=A0A1R3K5C3_9ROSI|nr:hypothetical protein COLO4_11291 [Corchorus olitorius]
MVGLKQAKEEVEKEIAEIPCSRRVKISEEVSKGFSPTTLFATSSVVSLLVRLSIAGLHLFAIFQALLFAFVVFSFLFGNSIHFRA